MTDLTQPIPVELTRAQEIQNAVNAMLVSNGQLNDEIKSTVEAWCTFIWNNPNGYTPQEIFTSLGTSAGSLVKIFGLLIEVLMIVDPTYIPPTTEPTVTKPDGTVLVTEITK